MDDMNTSDLLDAEKVELNNYARNLYLRISPSDFLGDFASSSSRVKRIDFAIMSYERDFKIDRDSGQDWLLGLNEGNDFLLRNSHRIFPLSSNRYKLLEYLADVALPITFGDSSFAIYKN
ncbi:MAG: hypothetical protein ACI83O_000748 [Patescibacteria group bacterium]|jgi:hypothetical protein